MKLKESPTVVSKMEAKKLKGTWTLKKASKTIVEHDEALAKQLISALAKDVMKHVRKNFEACLYHCATDEVQKQMLREFDFSTNDVLRRIDQGFKIVSNERD